MVGAGPAGLAAALELDRLGSAVRVIDKSADRSGLSKAVGVNARTLDLLEPSGVTDRLLDAGLKVPVINLRYGSELLAVVDFSKIQHRHRVGAQVVRESDAQFRMAAVHNAVLRPVRNFLVRHVLGSDIVQKNFRHRMAGLDHPAS